MSFPSALPGSLAGLPIKLTQARFKDENNFHCKCWHLEFHKNRGWRRVCPTLSHREEEVGGDVCDGTDSGMEGGEEVGGAQSLPC